MRWSPICHSHSSCSRASVTAGNLSGIDCAAALAAALGEALSSAGLPE
jgi:hypothetical protein